MNASLHDAYAAEYDEQVRAYGSHVHEALFGLCYEFLKPGQHLLDLGIGTGLSAELFARAGMLVHGMDFSPAMLALCREKGLAVELIQQDAQQTPWPTPSLGFEHVLSCGVFHFIPNLEAIFAEAQRALMNEGIYAFTTKAPASPVEAPQKYTRMSSGEMDIFCHAPEYIAALLENTGCELRKSMRCLVGEEVFILWVAQKPRPGPDAGK